MTPGELADDNELLGRLADLLADRVVERLMPWLVPGQGRLISAREVARMTGMTRRWVYDHAGDLGAVPLGTGPTPRLGFHPARVRQYLNQSVADPPTAANACAVLRQATQQQTTRKDRCREKAPRRAPGRSLSDSKS